MAENYIYKMYEWEVLPYDFTKGTWHCQSINMINKPIQSLSIHRNKNLSISMIANIKHDKLISKSKYQLGEIIADFEKIQIYNDFGASGTAIVTHIPNNTLTYDENGTPINKAMISIEELEVNYSDSKVLHTIEWITNLRTENNWRWSDSINMSLKGKFKKEFSSKSDTISIEREDTIGLGMSVTCLKFVFEDELIFIGETKTDAIDSKYCPGFILYQGAPSNEKMEQIRLALSYTLGRFFPSLGYSRFDEKWDIVSYKCVDPYDIEKRVYTSQTKPPLKLNRSDFDPINANIVSKSVESFCLKFHAYDLKHISWLYWHAVTSPVHVKASQFGATIETIQRNYIKINEQSFQTELLKKEEWKRIKKEFIDSIEALLPNAPDSKEPNEKRIIKNKIYNLNQTPQSEMTKRFFEVLELSLSEFEEKAFQQRNYSAHGGKGRQTGFSTTKNNRILRTLLNRILIKILNISPFYIDYYSEGYPQRNIKQPIGM